MSLRVEIEEMIHDAVPGSPLAKEDDADALVALNFYCDTLRSAIVRLAEELDVVVGALGT
jgi:hypothetical protein